MKSFLFSLVALSVLVSPFTAKASFVGPGFVNEDQTPMKRIFVYGGKSGITIRLHGSAGFSACDENTNAPGPLTAKADFAVISDEARGSSVYLKGFKNFQGVKNICQPGQVVIALAVEMPVVSEWIVVGPNEDLTIIASDIVRVEEKK